MNLKYKAEYASEVMETIPYGYVNKTICGCGLTTVALENSENMIIAVPTIGLMNNKVEQYPNDRCNYNILGVWGETDVEDKVGTNGSEIINYINNNSPIKIMVTYNSLKKVEFLLKSCRLIIDESNELLPLTRSFAKEINYLFEKCHLYKDTVSFISATPTPIRYMPDWISTIPQVTIEWEGTITATPILLKRTYPYKALREEIVKPLKNSTSITIGDKTFSRVIIFINSVDQILKTIKDSGIDKTDCAIICGDNLKNDIKISGINRYSIHREFPKYLFITKSGFSGIDLKSEDAMTVVVSNTSKKWQMVDALTDLKQAVSRQRLKSNPNYGSYIYIYNQTIFSKTEEELLDDLQNVYNNLENGIANWRWGKENNKEWKGYENDADFKHYTLYINGEYILNEQAFQADRYFILEIRRQYTEGFKIKSDVVIDKPATPLTIKEVSYSDLVDYFNTNKDNLDWNLVGGKEEWKELISKSYELYKTTWKNYTYAKQMVKSFGDLLEIIKTELTSSLKKGNRYTSQEIKDILSKLYAKYDLDRPAKVADLSDIIKTKQVRINNNRFIEII